jgi:hypothetical protein
VEERKEKNYHKSIYRSSALIVSNCARSLMTASVLMSPGIALDTYLMSKDSPSLIKIDNFSPQDRSLKCGMHLTRKTSYI